MGWREACRGALCGRAINDDNKVKVASAGGIAPLVQLLGPGNTPGAQEAAARALRNLAYNADNKKQIRALNAYDYAIMN